MPRIRSRSRSRSYSRSRSTSVSRSASQSCSPVDSFSYSPHTNRSYSSHMHPSPVQHRNQQDPLQCNSSPHFTSYPNHHKQRFTGTDYGSALGMPSSTAAPSSDPFHPQHTFQQGHGQYPGTMQAHEPSFAPVSFTEFSIRINHIERENMHLRYLQADLRAEVNILRDMLNKMPSPSAMTVSKPAADGFEGSMAAFLKLITADHSLLPHEELGYNCVRYAKDFPRVKFWQETTWKAHEKAKKGLVEIGQAVGQRGKTRVSQGENVTCRYVEDADGVPVDGHYITQARIFSRSYITWLENNKRRASTWSGVDMPSREFYFESMRKKFPFFQVCEFNWKANRFMSEVYYEAGRASRNSRASDTIKLTGANYTMADVEAKAESIVIEPPLKLPAPSKAATLDSLPYSDLAGALKRDAPTKYGGHAVSNKRPRLSIAVAGPSILSKSMTPATPSTPCLSIAVAGPSILSKPTTPSTASTLPTDIIPPHSAPRSEHAGSSGPVEAPLGTPRSEHAGSSGAVEVFKGKGRALCLVPQLVDDLIHLPDIPLPQPVSSSMPVEATLPEVPLSDHASANELNNTPATPLAEVTHKPASTSSKKTRTAAQNAKEWPPSKTDTQLKWMYARNWLKANINGTLQTFEHHYAKELTQYDKRKLSKQYKAAETSTV